MKRGIAVLLAVILVVSSALAACSSNSNSEKETTTKSGLDAANNEFGFETVEVTDDNGKTVTDKNGKAVTTEVNVEYVTDKNGKTIAKIIDKDGKTVTDSKGNEVTIDTDVEITTSSDDGESDNIPTTKKKGKTTTSTTIPTNKNDNTTEKDLTTMKSDKDKVPSTSAKGEAVSFSVEDQQIIKNMLEVPYLYETSYENADGVPIKTATHAAIWMAEREGLSTSSFASGTIVLDLFKYFGQTVVNFKTMCNDVGNKNINYVAKNDTFTISNFENETHTVTLEKIEDLGNNNYYKVTASVSGAKGVKKVYAIIQRNKLDSSLGFSIKALNWK